jgi:cytoskeletal protein RodZ
MVFVMRKLDEGPQTLGAKLRALRRGQAVSLDMMEEGTQIQRRYLVALERGQYHALPEPLYARNFIRAYARMLEADEHYFLELYDEECGRCDLVGPLQTPRQRLDRVKLFVWNRFVKFGMLALVVVSFLGYLTWQMSAVIAAPSIVLLTPTEAVMTHEASVHVAGFVSEESTVYVNGVQAVTDEDHQFDVYVDLEPGLNTITVEAERRYSRRASEERIVVFDPNDTAVE